MRYLLKSMMFLILAIPLFLVGCNTTSMGSDETEFVKILKVPSVKDINKSITIKREVDQGLFASRDVLYFTIYNQTSNYLWFPASSHVQIFIYNEDEKKWAEIQNRIQYSGDGTPIDPKGGEMDGNPIAIIPIYEKNGKPQQIRVAVTGYIIKDGKTTNEPVSAYIDVKIK